MVKIIGFVQENLQMLGQLVQTNLFLKKLYVVTSKKLELVLVFLFINLQWQKYIIKLVLNGLVHVKMDNKTIEKSAFFRWKYFYIISTCSNSFFSSSYSTFFSICLTSLPSDSPMYVSYSSFAFSTVIWSLQYCPYFRSKDDILHIADP